MSQISLTFPDGAKRAVPSRHHRPRRRQVDLAVARQAHGGDEPRRQARRPRRADQGRRRDQNS